MAGRAHGGPQTRGARMFRRHGRRIKKKRGAAAGLTPTVPRMEEQKNIRRFGFVSRNNTVCIYINRTILCAGPEGGRLRRTEGAAHGGPQAGRELVLQAVRVCGQAKIPPNRLRRLNLACAGTLQILAHFGHVLPVAFGHVRHTALWVMPRFNGYGFIKLPP